MDRKHITLLGCLLALVAAPYAAPAQARTALAVRADTATPKAAPAPPTAAAVEVGTGRVRFGGLLQAWYAAGDGEFVNTFRLRRAELKFVGEIAPSARWTVMVDPAKALSVSGGTVNAASLLLQDAFVSVSRGRVTLDVGQLKLPVGREAGVQSTSTLETVEPALFASAGRLAGTRDLGAMLRAPLGRSVDVQLGVFNGSGESQNAPDRNEQKAVAGRLLVRTPVGGLQVGGSGVWSGDASDANPRRDRAGVEAVLARGPLTLRAERMTGWDAGVRRQGHYLHAGYRVGRAEAVVRHDAWDPDTRPAAGPAGVTERDWLAGFSYFLAGSGVKLQANYLRKTFEEGVASRNLFLVNLQTAW